MNERHRFGADQIDCRFHVDSHVRVSVFVDRQAGGRMLNEDLKRPDFEVRYFGNGIENFVSDQVEASRAWREREVSLMPMVHGMSWIKRCRSAVGPPAVGCSNGSPSIAID